MDDLIIARAERLCLLRDMHRARKAQHIPRRLADSLRRVTTRVRALEVRYG
jgi:hypothetical protein